jgi:hypothetical protein
VIEAEVAEAIEIAEVEIGHDLRDSYLNASPSKQKKADGILLEIRTIYDSTDDENDKALDIFAKVLKLETVLGVC